MSWRRIEDNSEQDKSAFSDIPNLTKCIANKTLEQLENEGVFILPGTIRDADDVAKDQMVLQGLNNRYRTGNIMGFFGLGDERLAITSRFCNGDDDHLFQYLLEKVLDFPHILQLPFDANQDDRLFNFLLFLLPRYLQAALRKGPFKKYAQKHYNDDKLKGTIDISRHIRENTPFIGTVAYNQRELSFDNDLMELVRHTIEFVKGKPYGRELLAKAKGEVKLVVASTPGYRTADRNKVIDRNSKSPVRHAFYKEYLALQKLCLLILRHRKHQIGMGARQIYGVLVDGAWLWEEYLNVLIGDMFYHPMNKSRVGTQYLFEGSRGMVFPDFIGRDAAHRVIADAKYKPRENIRSGDYIQLLAYMFRFDAKTGLYLYPDTEKAVAQELKMNSGTTYEANVQARSDLLIVKHGLTIPHRASSYEVFAQEIALSEQELVAKLASLTHHAAP